MNITSTVLPQGSIGIYQKTNGRLGFTDGSTAEVRETERLASIDYIKKKMDGEHLSKEEMLAIVKDTVDENLSPVEMTAFVTASYIHGLDMDEVEHLTRSMVETGDRIQFATHPIVDKHSIGGVPGNKISLLVVPIIAASGLQNPEDQFPGNHGSGWNGRPHGGSRAG